MDRRRFIAGAGGIILTSQAPNVFGEQLPIGPDEQCRQTIRQTPGPYGLPDSALRSDIREGRPGVPIRLEFKVVNSFSCQPAEGCIVDIWQCGADGVYSGVENVVFDETFAVVGEPIDMRGKTFLRGHQVTDENGVAAFTTIYPGWYFPRLTHIHVRTYVPGVEWTTLDTQIYLPADVEQEVFRLEPYATRGPNPIDGARDGVIKGDLDAMRALTVDLGRDGDGFAGTTEISLDML